MRAGWKAKAFENVENQIGFCGIWCGSCVVGNGTLRELTKRYEEMLSAYGLEAWGPEDLDYQGFSKGLASIEAMPLCSGCLKGGGKEDCEIRACATGKGLEDCSECPQPADCKHVESLERMRSGARAAGLFVKTGQVDRHKLLKEWEAELRRSWPCWVLFQKER